MEDAVVQSSVRTRAGLPLLVPHVAARFGVSERTVRWWAATGRLHGRRIAVKIWAFEENDLFEFSQAYGREA